MRLAQASVALVTLCLVGCTAHTPNPNERQLQILANNLPRTEATAEGVGLKFRADELAEHVPPELDAAHDYQMAARLASKLRQQVEQAVVFFGKGDFSNLHEAQSHLRQIEPILDMAEKGCALPHSMHAHFNGGSETLSYSPFLRQLGLLFCDRACVEAHEARFAAAGDDIYRAGTLIRHIMEQPDGYDFLQAYFLHTGIWQTVEVIVTDAKGDPKCAAALLAAISTLPPHLDLQSFIPREVEQINAAYAYGDSELDDKLAPSDLGLIDSPNDLAKARAVSGIKVKTVTKAIRDQVLQNFTEYYEIAGDHNLTEKQKVDKLAKRVASLRSSSPVSSWSPEFAEMWRIFLMYHARQKVMLLGLQHLANPSPNDLLSPSSQIDPCTDKPLRAAKTPSGFIIYSLGVEGKDEGGKKPNIAFTYPYILPPGGQFGSP